MTRHLLVIGGQRCGTTYLHAVLDAHPQITMARPARPEPKFFLAPESVELGLQVYRARYFAHATGERLLGEKSTSYIESAAAAERARVVLGRAEIVVLLRDPVARAVSNWRFSAANGREDRPLEQALADNLEGSRRWDPAATSVSPYAYLERGRYADYLPPWLAAFPGQVHVRFSEELVGDAAAVGELYAALGCDPDFRPGGAADRVNESVGPAPALPPDLAAALREFFAPADAALRNLLGRDLPWDRPGHPA